MTKEETGTNGHAAAAAAGAEDDKKTIKEEISADVAEKIVYQIEYYFGDYNLPRDKFLQEQIKTDDGWIGLDTMLKFKRLANISSEKDVIAKAIKNAPDTFMEVDENGDKIRRAPTHPLPEQSEEELREKALKRTVYCKGFPKDGSTTLDKLLEFFKQYGPYETVHMRHFYKKEEKTQGFKGSILVVFKNEEKAKEFMELPQVTYEETNHLLRKWHSDYIEEKKLEIEARKAKKEEKKKKFEAKELEGREALEGIEEMDLPRGTFLHFSGLPQGGDSTREDIKSALGDEKDKCAWVDYSKGMEEGYLRLKDEGTNKTIMDKLGEKIKVNDVEITLRLVDGEEEDAQLKKMKEARYKARLYNATNKRRRTGGRGGNFKKRRT